MTHELIHYWLQPILHINTQTIIAHEFLCRWGPDLPWNVKDKALMKALIDCDCEQLPSERLHINLGPAAILSFAPSLLEPVFERFGNQLVLEWTEEYSSKGDSEIVAKRLRYWRRRFDVQISIDDFGAGQDGVGRVLLAEPDSVKIDGDLFRSAINSASHANILRRLCDWLNDSKIRIIIEHIETEAELIFARELGAEMGQGFFWDHLAKNFYYQQNKSDKRNWNIEYAL